MVGSVLHARTRVPQSLARARYPSVYKLRVVNQAIRRRSALPLVDQLVECCARDAELARGVSFGKLGHAYVSAREEPWLYRGLPGELERDPLIERDMLLCGLYGQGAMELFWHSEVQLPTKRALAQRRGYLLP
jgi:hypothetical protein